MKSKMNLAPAIEPEYLEQETCLYEDVENRHCIKSGSRVICYCSDVKECELIVNCKIFNREK